jgi:thiol:disulfide interchange protein DsbD
MAALPGFRFSLALSGALLLALPALAGDSLFKPKPRADALLPVDQAFQFQGARREDGALKLQWTVAPGYYLYRHMLKVSVDSPAKLSLAPLQLPKGEGKQDPEFGAVEIYRGQLLAHIPLAADVPLPRTLRVRYQGCADIGVCYPPQTKLVAVP